MIKVTPRLWKGGVDYRMVVVSVPVLRQRRMSSPKTHSFLTRMLLCAVGQLQFLRGCAFVGMTVLRAVSKCHFSGSTGAGRTVLLHGMVTREVF